jgi:paraquat-inducible protein B
MPEAEVVTRDRFSLVWLLPLVAIVVGGWLAYKTWSEQGPTVEIVFKTASGLQAGKTKVKFKDVEIGEVSAISVMDDLESVLVKAELTSGSERYLTDKTRFWVARPRVTASRVSGLETLLSGAYIAIDPVPSGERQHRFVGLAEPPVITTDEPGSRFRLRSPTLGSLNLGSPVYYRHIQVGQVVSYELDEDGSAVTITIFVTRPHDRLAYSNTRFWNASGVDIDLSASGFSVDTESLLSVMIGGVAFDTPNTLETKGVRAGADDFFPLYKSRAAAHERSYLTKRRFLMVFTGSVRGLSIGAQVLLNGIEIGRVLDIELRFDPESLSFSIPVLIEIEPERISLANESESEREMAEDPNLVRRLVAAGMRGQLKTGSLLTGQLYVEMAFHPDAKPATLRKEGDYQVIPTVPAPIETITNQVKEVLAKVNAFPIEQIGSDVNATLGSIRDLATSPKLERSLSDLEGTLAELHSLSRELDNTMAPELAETLTLARLAMKNLNGLIGPDAPLNTEAVRTMRDISSAARSIRTFADYLDRHPEALIRGKGGER